MKRRVVVQITHMLASARHEDGDGTDVPLPSFSCSGSCRSRGDLFTRKDAALARSTPLLGTINLNLEASTVGPATPEHHEPVDTLERM